MPYVEGEERKQAILFPETIDEYISQDNVVRVIDEYINQLNVAELGFRFAERPLMGRPPYNPRDMLKLYLYGFLNGIRSSRKLEHETKRNIEVLWLLKKLSPDFKTIADFRKHHKGSLKKIFRNFNQLCDDWDLFGKELIAIDGSKFKACNSKKNNITRKKIARNLKYIEDKVSDYMKQLDQNDELEEADRTPDIHEVNKRIQQLQERKTKYLEFEKELDESGQNEISTTDPDARLMGTSNNGVEVGYNVQTAVDAKHKLITDFEVTNHPNDLGQLDNMAIRTKDLLKQKNLKALADKGYYNVENLKQCVKAGITPYVSKQTYSNGTGDKDFYSDKFTYDREKDVYICPAGQELKFTNERKRKAKGVIGYNYQNYQACEGCTLRARCTRSKNGRTIFRHVDQDFLDTIDQQTNANMKTYRLRQIIVEHPFGTIKRNWGAYYFLTKGIKSVSGEMSLACLAYNFKRVVNILGAEEVIRRLRERKGEVRAV
jgi:transposase